MDKFKSITADLTSFIAFLSPDEYSFSLEEVEDVALNTHKYYKEIKIPKKAGGYRKINAVHGILKTFQSNINLLLQDVYNSSTVPPPICGFVKGRSIVDNAKKHTGKRFVINLDIKDFFTSITFEKINTALAHKPFRLHCRSRVNVLITALSTLDGVLPQGAPTSPILSNIALRNLDYAFVMMAKKYGVVYSRYADDLTFSGNGDIDYHSFVNTVSQRLRKHGYSLNRDKSRIQYDYQRQLVTGLVVNQMVNIKSEFLQLTKTMLHNWEKNGLEVARQKFFKNRKITDGLHFENVLRGRIDFIGSVLNSQGTRNSLYLFLNTKYWALLNCIDYSFISDEKVKKKLSDRNFECEKIAIDKLMYNTKEYRFVSYCFTVYTQMELLYKYYFYLKFNRDFMKIGLFLFDKSDYIRKQFKKQVPDYKDIPKDELTSKAKDRISRITNLKMISTFSIEDVFMTELYTKRGRNFPKFFNFIREIRNYHAHASDSIIKDTFEEVSKDVKKIIKSRNLKEITLDSHDIVGITNEEQKKIAHYRFYLWYQTSPFDDVRKILEELAYEIKVLEKNRSN